MQPDDALYVGHMLDTARRALAKASGKTRRDFDEDDDFRTVLMHLLQIIGEAARRTTAALQRQHPEVPWSDVIGMRHKIVHDYLGVDEDIVWSSVAEELDPLIAQLEAILAELRANSR